MEFDSLVAIFRTGIEQLLEGQFETPALLVLGSVFCLLVLAFLIVRLVFPAGRDSLSGLRLGSATRGARILGLTSAVLFFGVFGVWSWYAPLASAAVAPGVVNPDGSRKTVQHLEGGIIRTIHVREGDHVAAGDTLVTLEDVRALARLNELRERQVFLLATEARLVAEQTGLESVKFTFPEELATDRPEQIAEAKVSQRALFHDRRETQAARERILGSRIKQLREEITGLNEVISAQDEQLELLKQEIEVTQGLYDQKLQRLAPLLALKRQEAELSAEQAGHRATIARLEQQIGETELQLHATHQQIREEVSTELANIRAELATIKSQLPERADALARTKVTAPIAGQVLNLRVTTEVGGILKPGGEILDIVPDDGALIIEARLKPQDIDTVHPGMQARVLLTAYTQRNLPQIYGTLRNVSADRLIDDRTGEPYFLAQVLVPAEALEEIPGEIVMTAGMPADVMILTGERTVFDFVLKPFADSLRLSFRES
ncbi:HlyD family type I secretion periplasmic adaptor subunit [Marimonas lutisalis]|uniref:HlyD family type I secretion periplasmic adaptor subunit n=1 Tax=Marimonas lutisalis TaxID=2545756 RepID=UPI0010F4ABD2|nr:HlyD family type I secretion periplasmic adaptor subunit [Marimonas lutisalis]